MARSVTALQRRPLWERPGFVLWHAGLRWQREVAAALGPLDLTHAQFVLLAATAWLEAHDGPPSQRELADHAGTDAMMTSQVVRALELQGLLSRRQDPDDARVKRLHCTRRGERLATEASTLVDAVDRRCFGVGERRQVALEVLRRISLRDATGRLTRRLRR